MNIVEINGTNYSSTGNIALNIAKVARQENFNIFTCCKNSKKSQQFKYDNQIYIGTRLERIISEQLSALTGYSGYFNIFGTISFINRLKQIKPDLIHMHIMHDTYVNLPMLFKYIKKNNIPVVWTFHDCWTITGKCPYFERCNCDKWKTGCNECPQIKMYPESYFFDRSKFLWNKKKELFTGIKDLTIVTPTKWLANYVKQSYLKDNSIKIINNGINLQKFKPTNSNFKSSHNLKNKHIILGVAYIWSERKGLDTFINLSKELGKKYQIVLVGTNDEIDKMLPKNIISIHRTYTQEELIEIYSASDIFVNPTLEDNLPTVNIEALACGTPVITYKTGGSPEIIDETCGSVIEQGDIKALKKEIIRVCEDKPYTKEACIKRAKKFDMNKKNKEYIKLYKEILNIE